MFRVPACPAHSSLCCLPVLLPRAPSLTRKFLGRFSLAKAGFFLPYHPCSRRRHQRLRRAIKRGRMLRRREPPCARKPGGWGTHPFVRQHCISLSPKNEISALACGLGVCAKCRWRGQGGHSQETGVPSYSDIETAALHPGPEVLRAFRWVPLRSLCELQFSDSSCNLGPFSCPLPH